MVDFNHAICELDVSTFNASVSGTSIGTASFRNNDVIDAAVSDDAVIAAALRILAGRLTSGPALSDPRIVREYLAMRFAGLQHEVFTCLFLDSRHRVIAVEELFRGTIDGAAVYPREVVKRALAVNAAAVIFAHNHPSGMAEPSPADRAITDRLKAALGLVDVRVLDHLVVGGPVITSFVERGLL